MRPVERAAYLAHARTAGYLARLERARATIRYALGLCQRPFVGFSAGKDSSAMLWLVAEAWPSATALILTGGETRILYPSLDAILLWWRQQWPALDLREIHVDHVFGGGWEQASWQEQYDSFIGEWDRYLHASGDYDGAFIGLREEESNKRRIALRRFRLADCVYAIYRWNEGRVGASAGRYRICPLDRWSVADVAAVIAAHGIPLLESYEAEGIEARTHLRTGRTALRMGQLVELRQRDPAGYNRLLQRFPELGEWAG